MLRSRRASWLSGIGARVLIGGFLLAGSGPEIAAAASPTTEEILAKVNEVLAAIGGIKDGNHTLRWDQNLPAAQRFVVLAAFNNEAVLDKNTGLVWEKSPATTTTIWEHARTTCINKNVGGQKGWRLPAIAELSSLVDPSVWPAPTIPPGHPFTNVTPAAYWSATTSANSPTNAWGAFFNVGSGPVNDNFSKTFNSSFVWCVRGGMNADQY